MSVEKMTAVVWIVFAGICFASFYAFYQRQIVGGLLRSLLKSGADCPENAKTLSEIGYGDGIKRRFAERLLKKGSVLRKSVDATEEMQADPKSHHPDELFVKKEMFSSEARFYVTEEKRHIAEIRYDEKGTDVSALLLSIAASFAAALVVIALLPWFLNWVRNFGKTASADKAENETAQITVEAPIESEMPTDSSQRSDADLPLSDEENEG